MAEHNELGKVGEDAAVKYLEKKGFVILHRNWRFKHLELDIIALKDGEVRVIEVKTRSTDDFKDPIEGVDRKKRKRLMRATDAYIKYFNVDKPVFFDVITLVGSEGDFRIEHIEYAFSFMQY
ncbi:MAG: YraN family protein [Bacteroidaceae bacterium]|jgi:putative endonuclease|nr:YraN family protein [Bacteroidaceae bacterium]